MPSVILKYLRIADIGTQRIDAFVAAASIILKIDAP
jgi:hypothetical protein